MISIRVVRFGALVVLVARGIGCGGSGDDGGGTGPAAVPPAIATQPASISVMTGQTAGFAETATGTNPLAYQGARGGADIAGATAANYTTAANSLADDVVAFTVRVSNAPNIARNCPQR